MNRNCGAFATDQELPSELGAENEKSPTGQLKSVWASGDGLVYTTI